MLGALVENCGPRFQTTFADPQLVERIKLMSQDPLVDASVRKKLMRMLLSWHYQFRNEPTMRQVASLYSACGGGKKSDAQLKSEAAEAYRKRKGLEDRERQLRIDQKAAERLQKEEDQRQAKERKKGGNKRPVFDFQKVGAVTVDQRTMLMPCMLRIGEANNLVHPGNIATGGYWSCQCSAACQPRKGECYCQ
jgi:hypothetical protein